MSKAGSPSSSLDASLAAMKRRRVLVVAAALPILIAAGFVVLNRAAFPKDTTPEGAYARIVIAISEKLNPSE